VLDLFYSDVEGTNFLARGTGAGGSDMGTPFPVAAFHRSPRRSWRGQ